MKSFKTFLGESLKQHVQMLTALYAQMGRKSDSKVRPPAVLLNEHGKTFPHDASSYTKEKRGPQHMCYMNAGRLAIDKSQYTYCEGYVSIHGVPIEHAWCIDRQGRVVDVTITDGDGIGEYFGIAISTTYLQRTILKTRMWGILDPMTNKGILSDDPKDILA